MNCKKKWLSRRRNVEDIRKYIPVDGKVLKRQQTTRAGSRRLFGHHKNHTQTYLSDFTKERNLSKHSELISATTVSKGLREKSKCKENEADNDARKNDCYNDSTSNRTISTSTIILPRTTPIPDDSQCSTLLTLNGYPRPPIITDLIPVTSDSNEVAASVASSNEVTTTDIANSKLAFESDSYTIPKELSVTTILNILNCDTEEFINQLQ